MLRQDHTKSINNITNTITMVVEPLVPLQLHGLDKSMTLEKWAALCVLFYKAAVEQFNSLTTIWVGKHSGGKEELPLRRFPTVGIVWKVLSTITKTPPTNIITKVFRLPPLHC